MSSIYPKPSNEDAFEEFCLAFLKRHWKNPRLELYAYRGEKQNGVDIFDPSYRKPFEGGQCKHHEPHMAISPAEIRREVEKALTFELPLDHYAILTTAKARKNADDTILQINQDHSEKGLFTVELFDWNKIEGFLDDYPDVADLLVPVRNSQIEALTAEVSHGNQGITTCLDAISASIDRTAHDAEIDQAQSYLDNHDLQVAEALFEKVRRQRWDYLAPPQRYRVLAGLAQVRLTQGKDREAGKLLIQAKDANSCSEQAQISEAIGHEFLGEHETSHSIATRLRVDYPNSGKLAACWVRTNPETDPEVLKSHLSSSALEESEVWVALAIKAMRLGHYARAMTYAKSAIALEPIWVGPYLLHGQAGLQQEITHTETAHWSAQQPGNQENLSEALGSLNRAVEIARDQRAIPVLTQVLVLRAMCRLLLGDTEGGDDDYTEAVRLSPEDPWVLLRYSQYLRDRQDYDSAIKTLRKLAQKAVSAEVKHHLATVLIHRDGPDDQKEAAELFRELAFSVLNGPLPTLGLLAPEQIESIVQNAFHITIDNLIAKGEVAALDQYLGKLPDGRFSSTAIKTACSKQKLAAGEAEEAKRLSLEAADETGEQTSTADLRALASHLMKLQSHKEALPLWERICSPGEYSSDVRNLIRCAERVDRIDVILKAASAVREAGIDDPWLIHRELDVLQASDIERAIGVLQGYLDRHPEDDQSRLRLTLIGIDLDRPELVDARPEVIPDVTAVTSSSGGMAVEVLRRTGRPLEAVQFAYELYRRFRDDPMANMALFASVFAIDTPPPEIPPAEIVGPGCAILYEEEGRPPDWVIAEDSPAPDRAMKEFPPNDPLIAGLLGKRVDEPFVLGPGRVRDRMGIIREIVSKYVYRARYVAENWQVRFRDYPWLDVFRATRKNPETDEDEFDLAEMKLVADQQYQQRKDAEQDYRRRKSTIHIFAHNIGAKAFEASLHAATTPKLGVQCWAGPPEEWDQALAALQNCSTVVVDLSALATLYLLADEGVLANWGGKLIISQNTINRLRECLTGLSRGDRADGHYGKSDRGYHYIKRDAEAEEHYRNHLNAFISLISERAEVRGCEMLVQLDPEKRRTLSAVLGQHSLESILLGVQPGRVLWADDAWLLAIARSEFGAQCTWTQVAVEHGMIQGMFDYERMCTVGAKLLGMGYEKTLFHESIVWKAAEIADWDPDRWPFAPALEQLSNQAIGVGDAGRLAVGIITKLYQEVAFPPTRQRVILSVAERLFARKEGLALVMSLTRVLPQRFGLNVVHSDEVVTVLGTWTAEASSRIETGMKNLLILPFDTRHGEST